MDLSEKISELPHNCGLVALRHFHNDIPEDEFIFAFNYFCHLWPRDGVKDTEMFKVMDYLKVSNNYTWVDCTNNNIQVKDLLDGKKYIVLIKGHYLVIDKNKMIYSGFSSENHSKVVCYWNWKSTVQDNQGLLYRFISGLKKLFGR